MLFSTRYLKLSKNILKNKDYVKPQGYAILFPMTIGEDENKKALASFPIADGVMMVRIGYKLVKDESKEILGFGEAFVNATMTIKVLNRLGKEVLFINETSRSGNTLKYALGGVFEGKDTIPLVKESTMLVKTKVSQFLEANK